MLPEPQPVCSTHLRKPSCIVKELQTGVGVASTRRSDPVIPRGISVPGSFDEGEEVEAVDMVAGAWSVEAGLPALRESWVGFEVALAAETTDSEALEPHNLAEAKRQPDWPLWEQAICEELATLHTAGTWTLEHAPPGVLRPETVLFNFLILQTLSHMTHGEHRIVSGDSSTILSRDVA